MCIWPLLQNVIYTSDWMCERFAHSNRRCLAIFTESILPDSNGMAIGLNCSRVLLFFSGERWSFAARRCSTRLCGSHGQRCDGLTSARLAIQLLLPSIGIVCSKDRFRVIIIWGIFQYPHCHWSNESVLQEHSNSTSRLIRFAAIALLYLRNKCFRVSRNDGMLVPQ